MNAVGNRQIHINGLVNSSMFAMGGSTTRGGRTQRPNRIKIRPRYTGGGGGGASSRESANNSLPVVCIRAHADALQRECLVI